MKRKKNKIILAVVLISMSVFLHFVHYLVFQDFHHIMLYLLGDVAFIPIEILMVSLVFDQIIESQNIKEKKKKTYMLVELFYMELGNDLLNWFSSADKEVQEMATKIRPDMTWHVEEFKFLKLTVASLKCTINIKEIPVDTLYKKLSDNKKMLVSMISNPSLTEHDSFSDAVISTFHLLDELSARDLHELNKEDWAHLTVDMERVYRWLAKDWVLYMEHLRKEYPYLYSRAIKTNPFIL